MGVELSYLDDRLQYDVLSFCEEMDCTPSYSQSWHLHQQYREGVLDRDGIYDLLSQEKPNQREVVKVPMARIKDPTSLLLILLSGNKQQSDTFWKIANILVAP